jgi:hypothetical protein
MRPLAEFDTTTLTLHRIRGEFLEMPGPRLTLAQAIRPWNLDAGTCAIALGLLVTARFLRRTGDGAFVRVDEV